jgi:hypothetical protein
MSGSDSVISIVKRRNKRQNHIFSSVPLLRMWSLLNPNLLLLLLLFLLFRPTIRLTFYNNL